MERNGLQRALRGRWNCAHVTGRAYSRPRHRATTDATVGAVSPTPPLPYPLVDVLGPLDPEQIDANLASIGEYGVATRLLAERGLVPPDVLCGQTLFLLARQPRTKADDDAKRASPIAGGVWVREQVTIHAPVRRDEQFVVKGVSARRFVKKGRRYGVTTAQTFAPDATLLVSNCTTGLLEYQAEEGRADGSEGMDEALVPVPAVDPAGAARHPSVLRLRQLAIGATIDGPPVELALSLMLVRDGEKPANPIHSDPEVARASGLKAPIAGGSHVAAFLFERLMAEWGTDCLLHGAHVDLRWFAPTYGEEVIVPRASVLKNADGLLSVAVEVVGVDGIVRVRGSVVIPIGAGS